MSKTRTGRGRRPISARLGIALQGAALLLGCASLPALALETSSSKNFTPRPDTPTYFTGESRGMGGSAGPQSPAAAPAPAPVAMTPPRPAEPFGLQPSPASRAPAVAAAPAPRLQTPRVEETRSARSRVTLRTPPHSRSDRRAEVRGRSKASATRTARNEARVIRSAAKSAVATRTAPKAVAARVPHPMTQRTRTAAKGALAKPKAHAAKRA